MTPALEEILIPSFAHGLTAASALLPILLVWTESPSTGERLKQSLLFGVFLVVNHALLTLPRLGPFAELSWNWQGKLLQALWPLLFVIAWRALSSSAPSLKDLGLRRPERVPAATWALALLLGVAPSLVALAVGAKMPSSSLGAETLAFQGLAPSFAEELVYRGWIFLLVDRWAMGTRNVFGAKVGWGLIIGTLVFFLGHFVTFHVDGSASFPEAPLWVLGVGWMGFVAGWLRYRTGSLWAAVLVHGLFNLVLVVGSMAL